MAERIDKPKKMTRDWFRYIWDYYKVHILCVAAVAVLIVITAVEVLNTVHYDVNLNYIATNVLSSSVSENLSAKAEEHIADTNGDGEKHVSVTQINFTDEAMQDGNQILALENKLMAVFASDEEMLFILDEYMLRDVLEISATEGIFIPVEEWANSEIAEDRLYNYGGGVYAVSLEESAILNEMGIDSSDMYVVVKMNYSPEDEALQKNYENCVTLANALVKE